MKYLLLCCHEEKEFDAMSKSECDAMMQKTMAYCEVLKKTGQLLAVATRASSNGQDRAS